MPFVAFYHTHKLVVSLFVLIYLIKAILLLTGKRDALAGFNRIVKVPEMIISGLFLITGLAMLHNIAVFNYLFAIKLTLVVLVIPLAIIAYRKEQKLLAVLAAILLIAVYGLAEIYKASFARKHEVTAVNTDPATPGYDQLAHGRALYEVQCAVCHGKDGRGRKSGAKDLSMSVKTDEEITTLIRKGKNTMPAMERLYNEDELRALVAYVKTLRSRGGTTPAGPE